MSIEKLITQQVVIDEIPFGLRPTCGTRNMEKYSKKRRIYALHLLIWRKILIQCLEMFYGRKLGIDEWLIKGTLMQI